MGESVELVSRILIRGRIEDVWREITKADEPQLAVFGAQMEVEGGVEFTLISEEVPAGTKTEKAMKRGGDFIAATLKAIVERGRPPLGTRLLYGFFELLGPLMAPAKSRSEHWPLEETAHG